jgi:hypothetical protein
VYYTSLQVKQKRKSLPVYLSRRFQSHQQLTANEAVARYLTPAPALFIIGSGRDGFLQALKLRGEDIPSRRLQRIEWVSIDRRWRLRPFWLVRNFD